MRDTPSDNATSDRANLSYERKAREAGFEVLAGIDEAGRGAWAGPVVAAAVIMPPEAYHPLVTDSKRLTLARREELFEWVSHHAVAVGIGSVPAPTIDRLNILRATFVAMQEAVTDLSVQPDFLLVDGRDYPFTNRHGTALIKGDLYSFTIACASIIAKVTRDRMLIEYDRRWPQYGFARHKGYGTVRHREALAREGPLPQHRLSFVPCGGADTGQQSLWEEA